MLKDYHWGLLLLPPLLIIAIPNSGLARENLLTGTLGLGQEYDSNFNLSATDRLPTWSSIVTPGLSLTNRGPTDKLEVSYNLGLKKNYTTDQTSLNHDFLLREDTKISPRWQAGLLNRFYLSDDSGYGGTPVPGVDQELSARREKERFWLNTFSLHNDYQVAQDSTITMGYENRVLNNITTNLNNYTRHNPYLAMGYQLDPQWRMEGRYNYIRGEFDLVDSNLVTHAVNLRLVDQMTRLDQLSVGYGFNQTTYQGTTPNYQMHNINGGWTRNLAPQTTLATTAGPTIMDRDNRSARSALSYSAVLDRKMQQGSFSIGGKGGMDEMQFSGGTDNGLSLYWQLDAGCHYQLLERLRTDLSFLVRHNNFIDRPTDDQELIYQSSCGLSFLLAHGYEVSTRYRYKELDVTSGNGSYQDHQLMLELKVGHDLLQW